MFEFGSWKELTGWSADARRSGLAFQTGSTFSPETGRFTSPLEHTSVYLISVVILISYDQAGNFEFQVRVDGTKGSPTPLSLGRLALEPASDNRTLTLSGSGVARLSRSEYLSAFIRISNGNCYIEPMSTLSIVLLGEERSAYFAGFLTTPYTYFTESGKFKQFDWTFDKTRESDVFKKSVGVARVSSVTEVMIEIPGLYVVQSVVVAENVGSGNDFTVELSLCIDGQFSGRRVTAVAVLPYDKKVVFGAFGLLHLKKGQKLAVCFDSPGKQNIHVPSVFSIARLVPWRPPPGLQQQLLAMASVRTDEFPEWTGSGLVTEYERGGVLSANTSISSRPQHVQILVGGIYLFSVSSELYGEAAGREDICISAHRCSTCELQASIPVRKGNGTASLVGLLELSSGTKLWTCFNGSRTLLSARRSVQRLAGAEANTSVILMHNSTTFHGGGWQVLTNWITRDGEGPAPIRLSGLYLVAVNIILSARPADEVSVQVRTSGSREHHVLLGTFNSSDASNTSFSAAGIAHVTQGDAFSVLVYTASQLVLPDIHPVPATFYSVKAREGKPDNCFAVRYPQPMQLNVVSEWRTAIGKEWIATDQQCLPTPSGERRGTFVSRENGVYFVAATVRLRLDARNSG